MVDRYEHDTRCPHGTLEDSIFNRSGTAMVRKAALFAEACHIHQSRKYTGDPYFNHCSNVADLVKTITGDVETIAAAYLHDTVEDTAVTLGEIGAHFGLEVRTLVDRLTEGPWPDLNRKASKERQAERLRTAPDGAQTVKYADILDNTASIVQYDPGFAKVYLREIEYLLGLMTGGSQILRYQAIAMVRKGLVT